WLSTTPDETPSQALNRPPRGNAGGNPLTQLGGLVSSTGKQVSGVRELLGKLISMARNQQSMIRFSLQTPRSIFNRRISQQRRLGTQVLALDRFKAVADNRNATVNDVVLAVCGGAARAYLLERDNLAKKSLTASVPMALESSGGG